MKMTTPGADIKRFPLMTEASLISAGSRIDGRCRVYDPQGGELGNKRSGGERKFQKEECGTLGVSGTEEVSALSSPDSVPLLSLSRTFLSFISHLIRRLKRDEQGIKLTHKCPPDGVNLFGLVCLVCCR